MTNARKARQDTAEKAANLRAQHAAQEKRRRLALAAGAGAIVLAVGAGVTTVVLGARAEQAEKNGTPLTGVQEYEDLKSGHVQNAVTYEQQPPVGGDHNPIWLNCGIYSAPVQNENAVHSMEHGAVWITYQADLPEAQVETLKDYAKQSYMVLSPYENLDTPVAVSAWGLQMKTDSAEDPRIERFIKEYKQGPQTPEPGAACTGGVGEPED